MVDSAYLVKSTPLRAFIGAFQHIADMLQIIDILMMCMWKFDAEKVVLTDLQFFF